jgi:hypothetical protein
MSNELFSLFPISSSETGLEIMKHFAVEDPQAVKLVKILTDIDTDIKNWKTPFSRLPFFSPAPTQSRRTRRQSGQAERQHSLSTLSRPCTMPCLSEPRTSVSDTTPRVYVLDVGSTSSPVTEPRSTLAQMLMNEGSAGFRMSGSASIDSVLPSNASDSQSGGGEQDDFCIDMMDIHPQASQPRESETYCFHEIAAAPYTAFVPETPRRPPPLPLSSGVPSNANNPMPVYAMPMNLGGQVPPIIGLPQPLRRPKNAGEDGAVS